MYNYTKCKIIIVLVLIIFTFYSSFQCEERCSQAVYPYVNSVSGVPGKDVRDGCNNAQSYRSLPPVHRRASDYYQNLGIIFFIVSFYILHFNCSQLSEISITLNLLNYV